MNSLSQLSNDDLERHLKGLVQKERKLLHVILEHIKEVERRELYLEKAYSSMYAYLVQEMKYSGSAAMRRLEAARLLKEVPLLSQEIQAGNVNLSQIGELSRALKDKERQEQKKVSSQVKAELIEKISQKSLPESQQILSEALEIPIKNKDTQKVQRDASVRLEITLTKAQHEALLKCKEDLIPALKQKQQEISWGSVLEVLASQYLKKTLGPKKKENGLVSKNLTQDAFLSEEKNSLLSLKEQSSENRNPLSPSEERNPLRSPKESLEPSTPKTQKLTTDAVTGCNIKGSAQNLLAENDSSEETVLEEPQSKPRKPAKTLTPKRRREFLAKTPVGCEFTDPRTGKRCGSTFCLQVDHRQPRWAGGTHEEANLQVLCAAHNAYKYRQESFTRRRL